MKWFRHDSDATANPDLRLLIAEWGWDWYGRWWGIVEQIALRVSERDVSFALQTNNGQPFPVDLLARELGTTVQRLSDFCSFLADNRLIDPDAWKGKNLIFIPNLKKRTDEYTRKLLTKSGETPEQDTDTEGDKKKKYTPGRAPRDSAGWEYRTAQGFYDAAKRRYPTLITQAFEDVADRWAEALEQLQRLDGHSQEVIDRVLRFVCTDNFWGQQIRALPKLRMKDRQGTPYFNVMLQKVQDAGRRNGNGTHQGALVDSAEADPDFQRFRGGGRQ